MTVENTNNTISYTGNGSVDTFAYDFLVYQESHLFIYFDNILQTVAYTVTDIGEDNGGNVVFDTPPGIGVIIRIDRTVPETQLIEYQEYGPFPAKTNERGLDLLTMAVQQNAREIGRVVGGGSSTTISETPPINPDDGDKWKRCTDLKEFTYYVDENSGQWVEDRPSYTTNNGAVDSVNGQTGDVVLNKVDIGLSNVDNTTDLNKPISTATQAALNDKIETVLTDDVSVFGDGVNTPLSASGGSGGAVDSVNGETGDVTLTTDDISDSAATNKYTSSASITKLAGIEYNATANSTDATLLDRANHTGTQTAATISDFEEAVKDSVNTQDIVYLEDVDALNYTLSASDTGKFICFNTPNISTITIPDNLPLGTSIVTSNLGQNNPTQGGVTISINETVRGALTIADVAGMMSITKVVTGATNADNIWQSSERA
jgi:hypothetical protein